MRGEQVIVKDYKGRPWVRRVWDSTEDIVFLTNDLQYELLKTGRVALEPLGCPRKDVFKSIPKIAMSAEQLYKKGKWDWNKLTPY